MGNWHRIIRKRRNSSRSSHVGELELVIRCGNIKNNAEFRTKGALNRDRNVRLGKLLREERHNLEVTHCGILTGIKVTLLRR